MIETPFFLTFSFLVLYKEHHIVAQAAVEPILLQLQSSGVRVTGITTTSSFRLGFFLRELTVLRHFKGSSSVGFAGCFSH